MSKKILITGGAGFIGSHLADELINKGYSVRALDNLSEQVHGNQKERPAYLNPEVELQIGDVRDKEAVLRAFDGVDAVFHLAAMVGVGQSMYQIKDYTDVNNVGTAVLLEALMDNPVEKLVVASSMSIYGWYVWTRKVDAVHFIPITRATRKENMWSILIFLGTVLFTVAIYNYFDKWNDWTAYVDTFTTGIFFLGMWLMAKKKLENWIYWIIGDIISVPLYLYKGLALTSLQYLLFTIIAFYGYRTWKRSLSSGHVT